MPCWAVPWATTAPTFIHINVAMLHMHILHVRNDYMIIKIVYLVLIHEDRTYPARKNACKMYNIEIFAKEMLG